MNFTVFNQFLSYGSSNASSSTGDHNRLSTIALEMGETRDEVLLLFNALFVKHSHSLTEGIVEESSSPSKPTSLGSRWGFTSSDFHLLYSGTSP
jgi:hypothetical protein